MNKYLIILGLFICSIGHVSHSMALSASPSNAQLLDGYKHLGNGLMKVMFWEVYEAELYVQKIPFKENVFPQALKITYLRDIDKDDLIEATKDQWQHIGISEPQQKKWLTALANVFPNIKEGETITLVVDSLKQSNFYFTSDTVINQPLGEINDIDFGHAFLAIWLSEKTSRPALRQQLLGNKK